MKKKFLTFVLMICFIIPCAFLFVACGEKEPPAAPTYIQALVSIGGADKATSTGAVSSYGNNPYNDTDLTFYREMSDGTFVEAERSDFTFSITDSEGDPANADRLNFRQLLPGSYTATYTDSEDTTKEVKIYITVEKAVNPSGLMMFGEVDTFSYPNMPEFYDIAGLTINEDYGLYYIEGTEQDAIANGYTNLGTGTNTTNSLFEETIFAPGTYCVYAHVYETELYKSYYTDLIEITIEKSNLTADESVIAEKFGTDFGFMANGAEPITLQDIVDSGSFGTSGVGIAIKNSKGQEVHGTFTFTPELLGTIIYADNTTRYFDATFVPSEDYNGGYNTLAVSIPVTLSYRTLTTPDPINYAMNYTGQAHTIAYNMENLDLFDIYYIDTQGQKTTINGLNPDMDTTQLPNLVDRSAVLPGTYKYRMTLKDGVDKYYKIDGNLENFDFEYTINPLHNQIGSEASETFPFERQLVAGQQNVFEIKLTTNEGQIDIDTLTATKSNTSLKYSVEIDKTKCEQVAGQGENPDTTLIVVKITIEADDIAGLLNSETSVNIQFQIDGTTTRAGYETLPSDQDVELLAPIEPSV